MTGQGQEQDQNKTKTKKMTHGELKTTTKSARYFAARDLESGDF